MKKGFTLAEVLVTLAIIGVVAALTAPALVINGREQANAARLSVVVSNLENAFAAAISTESVNDLFGTGMWVPVTKNGATSLTMSAAGKLTDEMNEFIGELGKYLNFAGKISEKQYKYYEDVGLWKLASNGGKGSSALGVSRGFGIEMKNGAIVFMSPKKQLKTAAQKAKFRANGGRLVQSAGYVYIDVNGLQPPNTFGRDNFEFEIGADGILHPVGGTNYDIYRGGDGTGTWDNEGSSRACLPEKGIVGTNGEGCTARVISEGYKINY